MKEDKNIHVPRCIKGRAKLVEIKPLIAKEAAVKFTL